MLFLRRPSDCDFIRCQSVNSDILDEISSWEMWIISVLFSSRYAAFEKSFDEWAMILSSPVLIIFFKTFKNFMTPFCGWGSTASRLKPPSRLEPLRGGSLLFTTKSPEIPGTDFIGFGRMNGWVDLRTTQWFWTWDPWIGNPAP